MLTQTVGPKTRRAARGAHRWKQDGEQALVGLFVIVAAVVLVATVFGITGAFGRSGENVSCVTFRSPEGWKWARRCATRVDPSRARIEAADRSA